MFSFVSISIIDSNNMDFFQFNRALERIQQEWIEQQCSQTQVVKSLKANCKKLNLAYHGNTPGDGNCFFNAISDQLSLLGLPHQSPWDIRQSVVEFLRRNPSLQVCTKSSLSGFYVSDLIMRSIMQTLSRPVARLDFGGVRNPSKWTFWT